MLWAAPCSGVRTHHLSVTLRVVGGQTCEDESQSLAVGAGLEGATLRRDLLRSLNHIRAAVGRLPGAWRVEREAQAGDLSASPPFYLLPWRDSLLHTWGCSGRPGEGLPAGLAHRKLLSPAWPCWFLVPDVSVTE